MIFNIDINLIISSGILLVTLMGLRGILQQTPDLRTFNYKELSMGISRRIALFFSILWTWDTILY